MVATVVIARNPVPVGNGSSRSGKPRHAARRTASAFPRQPASQIPLLDCFWDEPDLGAVTGEGLKGLIGGAFSHHERETDDES